MADAKRGRKALTDADKALLKAHSVTLKGGPGRTASKETIETRSLVSSNAPTVKDGVVAFVAKGSKASTPKSVTTVKVPGGQSALRDALSAFVKSNGRKYRTIPVNGATWLVKN